MAWFRTLIAVAAISVAGIAHAQIAQWQGNFNDDWEIASNWSTDPDVPDGFQYQWQIDLQNLIINSGTADVGSITTGPSSQLYIRGGSVNVNGNFIGGFPDTTFDNLVELDGGDLTLRNLDLRGSGQISILGNNDILTLHDTVGINANVPDIIVNDGLLQLIGDHTFDPNFIQFGIDIQENGKAYLSPDGFQDIDLYANPFSGSEGHVIFDPADYILGSVNGKFELYEGGRFFSSSINNAINIGFGDELLLSGGDVFMEPDAFSTHVLRNQNGTIRGFGRVDLSDPNAEYVGGGGQIIADESGQVLEIKGAGASALSPQADTLGTLLATNGATLLVNGLNSFNSSGATVEADGGTVRLIRLTEFEWAHLHAHDGGDIQVGSPVPSNSSVVTGSLKLEDNGLLIVLGGSTFKIDSNPFGGPMIDQTSAARIDGTLLLDTTSQLQNEGTIDLKAAFAQGQLMLGDSATLVSFEQPGGVLDLGSTGGGFRPIVPEFMFQQPELENGQGHTIRGGGLIDLSRDTGIRLTNYGTVESQGSTPLAFVGDPSNPPFERMIPNGGLFKVNAGTAMSFSDVRIQNLGGGSLEVAGALTLTDSEIEVNTATLTDGAVVTLNGTTSYFRAEQLITTGTVSVVVDGPMPTLGSPSFDAASLYINDGSSLSADTTVDMMTGVVQIDNGGPVAINDGNIYIRSGAKLAISGSADLNGGGTIHFGQQASAPPIINSDGNPFEQDLTTSNSITGQADLTNLNLVLAGNARLDPDSPAGGIGLNRLTMFSNATLVADLSSNIDDIVVDDQTIINGTLILETTSTDPTAGFNKYVVFVPNEDLTGQFHTVSVGEIGPGGPTLQITDDLAVVLSYGSDGVTVRVIGTGDTTNDGNVNQQDLNIVLDAFGANTNTAGGVGTGDLTGDGVVDYNDFTQVLRGWTSTVDPIYGDVPEPGVGLILLGGLGVLTSRRRRG